MKKNIIDFLTIKEEELPSDYCAIAVGETSKFLPIKICYFQIGKVYEFESLEDLKKTVIDLDYLIEKTPKVFGIKLLDNCKDRGLMLKLGSKKKIHSSVISRNPEEPFVIAKTDIPPNYFIKNGFYPNRHDEYTGKILNTELSQKIYAALKIDL